MLETNFEIKKNLRKIILNNFSYENAINGIHVFLKDKVVEFLNARKSV